MQVEVRFPVDEESRKGFLATTYFRRDGDKIEFGVAKKDGFDYAWSVISLDEFKAAIPLLFPELKING